MGSWGPQRDLFVAHFQWIFRNSDSPRMSVHRRIPSQESVASGTINDPHLTDDVSSQGLPVPSDNFASPFRTDPNFDFPEGNGSYVLKSLYHALGHTSHEEVFLFPIITKTVLRDLKEMGSRCRIASRGGDLAFLQDSRDFDVEGVAFKGEEAFDRPTASVLL
ncbi:hypothetical protein AMTR_s00053p00193230 [Amborella trichopoda]|uniref:Uncharacterized protein n=1 Tax=Amborella trichopoda TaxID=13333 RepID=W1PB28_AMBTC|nr:hypothetical protein AMTR_s00053p00193230 [Amborella trichopoda]